MNKMPAFPTVYYDEKRCGIDNGVIELGRRDQQAFAQSMLNPEAPNEQLRATAKRSSDPRDQPVTPTPYYVQFRQSLQASEHITVLAKFLRHVVDLYDGRLTEMDSTPPELRYIRASEMAVRYCSVEARTSAERRAEAHGISRFDELLADLKLPEATEAVRREMLAQYVHDCIRVYCYSLTHACGRSKEEITEFNRLEARDAGQ